jgi:hypothetical protein
MNLLNLNPPLHLQERGDQAKPGGGAFLIPKNPSTARRAVPLPRKTGGGFKEALPLRSAILRMPQISGGLECV